MEKLSGTVFWEELAELVADAEKRFDSAFPSDALSILSQVKP